MTYTFANGAYIEFFSVDDEQKARGPRRDILYMNEANKTKWDTFYQLLIRTKFDVFIDYNPTSEFWVNHELVGRKDVEVLTLTYKDNEATPRAVISEFQVNLRKAFYQLPKSPTDPKLFEPKNVKNNHWANWCRVYVFGQIGTLEGAVYKDWTSIDKIPKEAKLLGYGLDFGYSNDPTALVAVYKMDGRYYVRELIYKTHLTSSALVREMKKTGVLTKLPIVADSADPRMIDEICDAGFDCFGAEKGRDSINFGIDLIQDNGFIVEEGSENFVQELRNYLWKETRAGKTLNKPIDDWNHLLDAFRYFAMEYFTPKANRGASSGISYSTM
jgi:phage terminase large subunit